MNKYISAICKKAKDSSHSSSRYNTRIKNNTLKSLISEIKNNVRSITSSNEKDIKSEDWSVWLSDSSYLTQQINYIVLSEPEPILESIIVYVDQEAIYDWSYIEETNTVKLGFTPDYGSVVEVGYNVYVD